MQFSFELVTSILLFMAERNFSFLKLLFLCSVVLAAKPDPDTHLILTALYFLLPTFWVFIYSQVCTISLNFFFFFFNKFIFLWLCWVFVSVRGLSLVAASGGYSSSRCAGFSLSWLLLLRSTGSRCAGSVVVLHGLSCSAACGILPDQGSNPCSLHWQADSQPLHHQGSPLFKFLFSIWLVYFTLGTHVAYGRLLNFN